MEHSVTVQAHSARKEHVAGIAHNMFLSVASQLGLVGLLLFLGILFFAFKAAMPIARRSGLGTGIFLGLIVSMIAGLTLTWELDKALYVLFGSVLALQLDNSARQARAHTERRSPPLIRGSRIRPGPDGG
jgi:O-antigen ligase